MSWTQYILPVTVSIICGCLVSWIAIKIIFTAQRKKQIAQKLGAAIDKEFNVFDNLELQATNPENFEKLKPHIEEHIDNFLKNKLKTVFPMLSMFIGDKTIEQFKAAFLTELEILFPALIKNYLHTLKNDINIEEIVAEKISGLSFKKIETMLNMNIKTRIVLTGAIFGCIIGIIQIIFINLVHF